MTTSITTEAKPKSRFLRRLGKILLMLGTGALMAMAYPPYDFGDWVWVGLLPLLTLLWLGREGFWRGFGYGWFFGMGWYCTTFSWIPEVGHVFNIPSPIFWAVAFLPLMTVYSCLVGLWSAIANTLLRPRLEAGPDTANLNLDQKKDAWTRWANADLLSTLRCAVGGGAMWVCIEWLRANGTLGFSWNSLGMALYNGLSFVQWAEFVGTAALSFIPVCTTIIIWCAVRRSYLHFKGFGKGCRPWDFYGMIVILMGLFIGGLYMSKAYAPKVLMRKDSTLQLPVMGVQINLDQQERILGGTYQPELYGIYLRTTRQGFDAIQRETVQKAMKEQDVGLTQQLPVWVIWPESAMGTPLHRDASTGQYLVNPHLKKYLFNSTGLPLVRQQVKEIGGKDFVLFTGVDEYLWREEEGMLHSRGMYNSLVVMEGGEETIKAHPKQHLMPFGEYIPLTQEIEWIGKAYSEITGTQVGEGIHPGTGSEPMQVSIPGTNESIGVIPAVCYEDTVGRLLTKYVRKGPQVIVNISNDGWFRHSVCGEQQARNAAFRCIELRRPMVRAANMGVTCTIAPNGAEMSALRKADGTPHLAGYSYGVLPVDKNAGFTLYALLGDWAVVLCSLLVIGLSIPATIQKKTK